MRASKAEQAWLTLDVWKIAGSAFFADLGYQAVLAGFPLFLVLTLHAPVWVYGLAMALAYGPGALMAWWGGRLGDHGSHRQIAITGNSVIPLLSLTGLVVNPIEAIALFAMGWWGRNFRTPSRRVLLTRRVMNDSDRRRAFGFLHALDVGGGILAGLFVVLLLALHWPLERIFLVTLIPLALSTLCLWLLQSEVRPSPSETNTENSRGRSSRQRVRGVLWAAGLYGFSSYNLGFPILTVADNSRSASLGVVSYVVFLGVSALTGWVCGRWAKGTAMELSGLGYGGAALGSAGLGVTTLVHGGLWGLLLSVALLGFALGVIETLEPTLIARWTDASTTGGGMGALTGMRSLGLFGANLIMGLLYHLTPSIAYGYATLVAILAASVLLVSTRTREEH